MAVGDVSNAITIQSGTTAPATTSMTTILEAGYWTFTLETTGSAVSVAVNRRQGSETVWRPITKAGAAIALTEATPEQMIHSNGETFQVVRTGDNATSAIIKAIPMVATKPAPLSLTI